MPGALFKYLVLPTAHVSPGDIINKKVYCINLKIKKFARQFYNVSAR
jgi:hypothetical protein